MPATRCPSATDRCSRPVSAAMSWRLASVPGCAACPTGSGRGSHAVPAARPAPARRGSPRAVAGCSSPRRQSPGRPAPCRRRSTADPARSRRSPAPAAQSVDAISVPRRHRLGAARRTGDRARPGRPAPSIARRPRAPRCRPGAGFQPADMGCDDFLGRGRAWPGPARSLGGDPCGTDRRSPARRCSCRRRAPRWNRALPPPRRWDSSPVRRGR